MAAPIPRETIIEQARDFYLSVTWKNSAGTPINLTGYSAAFSIRQDYGEPIVLAVVSPTDITLGGAAGTVIVHLDQTQTSIDEGIYVCELVVTSGSNIETSLLKGNITVRAKVVA
jgi:hypothetical protein